MSGKPTWDEVKARSVGSWNGLEIYCGDCSMAYDHAELPCRKHATPEEQVLIDELVLQALANLQLIKRRGDG